VWNGAATEWSSNEREYQVKADNGRVLVTSKKKWTIRKPLRFREEENTVYHIWLPLFYIMFYFSTLSCFLFSTHWPQFSFFNIVLFLVFNGHLMQGHWATLSLFKLKLSVEAEGKGRWRSMFDTLTRLSNQFVICTLSM